MDYRSEKSRMLAADDTEIIGSLQKKLSTLQDDFLDKDRSLKQIQSNFENLSRMADADRHNLRMMRGENAELRSQLEEKTKTCQKYYQLQSRHSKAEQDVSELSAELRAVTHERDVFMEELTKAKRESDGLVQQIRITTAANRKLEEDANVLRRSDSWSSGAVDDLRRQTVDQRNENEQMKQIIDEFQARIDELENTSGKAKNENFRVQGLVERKETEVSTLRRDLANTRHQLALVRQDFEAYRREIDSKPDSTAAWEIRLAQTVEEWKKKLQQERERSSAALKDAETQYKKQYHALEESLEDQRRTVLKLANDSEDNLRVQMQLKEGLEESRMDSQREKERIVADYAENLHEMRKKMEILRRQLRDSDNRLDKITEERDEMRKNMNSTTSEMAEECEQLRAELAAARASREDNSATIIQDLDEMNRKYIVEKDRSNQLGKQVRDEVARFKSKMADEAETRSKLQDEIDSLANRIERDKLKMREVETNEKYMRQVKDKLYRAQEAVETEFQCLRCLNALMEPVILVPCGHNFCRKCVEAAVEANGPLSRGGKGVCPECQQDIVNCVANTALDNTYAKFQFQRQALESLNVPSSSRNTPSRNVNKPYLSPTVRTTPTSYSRSSYSRVATTPSK